MKNYLLPLFTIFLFSTYAQVAPPQAFSYSAVARDGFGNPLGNQNVGIQFSVLKGSTVGQIQYQENHFTTTNQFGLFTLILGTGSVQQGSFTNINWGNDSYYLKVGLDATGGTNFATMGTTQFLSVPYALYAGSAGNQSYQTLSFSQDTLRLTSGGSVYLGNYHDAIAHQTLTLSNDTLSISQGNNVVLPTSKFVAKINGVAISDPSINHVAIGSTTFLTSTNYRYDLSYVGSGNTLGDTMSLTGISYNLLSASGSCTSLFYVPANNSAGGVSPGRIFSTNYGQLFYVPLNATRVTLSPGHSFDGSNCNVNSGNFNCYPCYVNNPVVTGFPFTSNLLSVTFTR